MGTGVWTSSTLLTVKLCYRFYINMGKLGHNIVHTSTSNRSFSYFVRFAKYTIDKIVRRKFRGILWTIQTRLKLSTMYQRAFRVSIDK